MAAPSPRILALPLFFFHIRDRHNITDTEGVDLACKAEALQEAIKSAGQIIADEGSDLCEGDTWTMTVSDRTGGIVCMLSFSAKGRAAVAAPVLRIMPTARTAEDERRSGIL